MKNYLYLTTVIIGSSMVIVNTMSWAQCVTTQDCTALGYTETSCPNGGVKCPFGNRWACFPEPDKTAGCIIGALYYSDGSCSDKLESSKTLLGVVIYEKSDSENGWIMAVNPIDTLAWEPGEQHYSTGITDKAVSASCTNTQKLVALGSRFEAANAANNYKPTGTPSGKSWCLPSYDLLNNLTNSFNFAKVNAGFTIAKGSILGTLKVGSSQISSSSEYDSHSVWIFNIDTRNGKFNMVSGSKFDDYNISVRPVMEF